MVAAQVINYSLARPKRMFQPEDFIFTNPPAPVEAAPQTSSSMLAAFDTAARLSAVRK